MDDQPPPLDVGADHRQMERPRTPRWVKVFGIVAIVLVVLLILMLTGVFGKGHGPSRHMGGAGGATSSSMNIGAPAAANEAARTIEIATLDALAFEPASVAVAAGETVTFSITNNGETVHEFTLGGAAMQQEHAEMMAHIPAGMGHDTPNSVTVEPGQTKLLTWRFGDAGTLEYACHQQGHYQGGMRGQVSIT